MESSILRKFFNNIFTFFRFQKKQKERHITDSQNVFYQHPSYSLIAKKLEWIDYSLPRLSILIVLLSCIYIFVGQIKPYEHQCPEYATCGVYVHCKQGYMLDQYQLCQTDPQMKERAQIIAESEIQRLQTIFGDQQCMVMENSSHIQPLQLNNQPPKISFIRFFYNKKIQSTVLRHQLVHYFDNSTNQKTLGFQKNSFGNIYPTRRLYSLTCKVNLFYNNHFVLSVILVFIVGVIIIVLGYYCYSTFMNTKAKALYSYLLSQLMNSQNGIIPISQYQEELQIRNGFWKVSESLWKRINEQRIEDRKVGCFEDPGIKWNLFEHTKKKSK